MNTNKKTIRLTESKLRSIIAESIKKVLSEGKVVNNKYGSTGCRMDNPFERFGPSLNDLDDIAD